jgi:hypothetical protein
MSFGYGRLLDRSQRETTTKDNRETHQKTMNQSPTANQLTGCRGRTTGLTNPEIRKCKCDLCTKWRPLHKRIIAKLRGKDRKLFDEYLMMNASDSDDLCAANAKLAGDWPGWSWMKVAKKIMLAMPNNENL